MMQLYLLFLNLNWSPLLNARLKVHGKYSVVVNIYQFKCSKDDFYAGKKVSDVEHFERSVKKRRSVGASCSFLLRYLYPANEISGRYPNKDKCDALGGIIIGRRDNIRVIRRKHLCIFMKHEDFGDHELHSVQNWLRVIREDSEAHAFKDSEQKEERGQVQVESDDHETPIHATT